MSPSDFNNLLDRVNKEPILENNHIPNSGLYRFRVLDNTAIRASFINKYWISKFISITNVYEDGLIRLVPPTVTEGLSYTYTIDFVTPFRYMELYIIVMLDTDIIGDITDPKYEHSVWCKDSVTNKFSYGFVNEYDRIATKYRKIKTPGQADILTAADLNNQFLVLRCEYVPSGNFRYILNNKNNPNATDNRLLNCIFKVGRISIETGGTPSSATYGIQPIFRVIFNNIIT